MHGESENETVATIEVGPMETKKGWGDHRSERMGFCCRG